MRHGRESQKDPKTKTPPYLKGHSDSDPQALQSTNSTCCTLPLLISCVLLRKSWKLCSRSRGGKKKGDTTVRFAEVIWRGGNNKELLGCCQAFKIQTFSEIRNSPLNGGCIASCFELHEKKKLKENLTGAPKTSHRIGQRAHEEHA